MTCRISLASPADAAEIDDMLGASSRALMHYGPAFRGFLERALPGSTAHYLVARVDARMAGILPALATGGPYGTVVNSLPFFGSHGGPWVTEHCADGDAVAHALLREFSAWLEDTRAAAATIVANPLDPQDEVLQVGFGAGLHDRRIGQVLRLPAATGSQEGNVEALFAKFHHKTRNAVRKAAKSGFEVTHTDDRTVLEALAQMHAANIASLGGAVKPPAVFHAAAQCFRYDQDYRLYVARRDGQMVAALLVLFFYGTAEYFVPATLEEFRSLQPMSLLITEAMAESVRRGCRLWNWGGTWESQAGVHMFKSRWGSEDLPYRYHVRLRERALLQRRREELLAAYPGFYVLPFAALETAA